MPAQKARTVEDFRNSHDKSVVIPNKIRAALAEMAKIGPQHHEYEVDFLKLAGLSTTDLGKYRDQFKDHIVVVNHANGKALPNAKNVWFADKKVAAKVRG